MGKTPQKTNFGASISRTFAEGQKWMVVTGLSVLLIQSLSCVGLLTVVAGSWEWTYSCVGTHKEENSSKGEREETLPWLSSSGREGDWQCLASFEFPTSD